MVSAFRIALYLNIFISLNDKTLVVFIEIYVVYSKSAENPLFFIYASIL